MDTLYSNEAQKAIDLGLEHHWRFRVVSGRGTIDKPLPKEGCWFYPPTANSIIPKDAQKRIDMLNDSGVGIKQIIIGHEASKLLNAPPKPKPVPIKKIEIQKPKKDPVELSIVADVLATTFKLAFGVAAAAVGITVWIMGTALSTALLLDPSVIVVLEDGTWLECMSWYE